MRNNGLAIKYVDDDLICDRGVVGIVHIYIHDNLSICCQDNVYKMLPKRFILVISLIY